MRLKPFVAVIMLVVLNAVSAVWAEESRFSSEFDQCMDRSGGATFDMIECMTAEHEKQDVKLNAAYKKLMNAESEERKKKLREAQRAWIKFRDAYGDFIYDPDGGTLARVEANYWNLEATAEQAKRLEELVDRFQ